MHIGPGQDVAEVEDPQAAQGLGRVLGTSRVRRAGRRPAPEHPSRLGVSPGGARRRGRGGPEPGHRAREYHRRPAQSTARKKPRNSCWGFDATWATVWTSAKAMWRACAPVNRSPASLVASEAGHDIHQPRKLREQLLGWAIDQLERRLEPLLHHPAEQPNPVGGRGDHLPAPLGRNHLVGADPVQRPLAGRDLRVGEQVVEPVLEQQLLDRRAHDLVERDVDVLPVPLAPGRRGPPPGRSDRGR